MLHLVSSLLLLPTYTQLINRVNHQKKKLLNCGQMTLQQLYTTVLRA